MLLALYLLHFYGIFIILAGNKDSHKGLDEFEFQLESTKDCGVTCPWASEKYMYNLVSTLVPSFLIGSSSYWQVTRTTVISQTSLNYGQIRPRTAELAVIQRILQQCNNCYILIFFVTKCVGNVDALCNKLKFLLQNASTLQNVTIVAKCVDRWHMLFVTFCDDSIKKILTWKIVSWFESWHNYSIIMDTFMYVTNPISIWPATRENRS